jgi:SM-20-related protein
MYVSRSSFNAGTFSFHEHPVLVIENFWTASERQHFRDAMQRSPWQALQDMPYVRASFPNCGNWQQARLARPEAGRLLDRLAYPCIESYIESFPSITGRSLSFSYYSYGSGDCLLTHDDTVQDGNATRSDPSPALLRRLALVTYMHEEWESDWGGELIIYSGEEARFGLERPKLRISHCIAPEPGSLVLFTVPRFHRVCRVDPVVGDRRRLSIAGWFLTEHAVPGKVVTRPGVGVVRSSSPQH